MNVLIVYSTLFIILATLYSSEACKGCINADEWSFKKLIPKFKLALVKFDVAFPYGDKQDKFANVAEEFATTNDIAVIQIGVKDYGDKENMELAAQYGIRSKEDLPQIKIFTESLKNPVDFPGNSRPEWSESQLREFVRVNAPVYVGYAGCLEEFDKIARKFMGADNKEEILKEAETMASNLDDEEDKVKAKNYLVLMKKVIEKGTKFVKQERQRLKKLLKEGKVKEEKKKELTIKSNVVKVFDILRDEL